MAEYIDKGAALAEMSKHGITRNMRANKAVAALPSADVAPVVHGLWVKGTPNPYCSKCFVECRDETPYCPNCGAKMDGGKHD